MVRTKQQAIEIAALMRTGIEKLYGPRLRAVLLFGSAARDALTENSDIDIAIVLDTVPDRFAEYERISELASRVGLEHDTLVSCFFVPEADYNEGRYAAYRAIKREGVAV